jgi:Na+(H+)/acetate symporter ActP
MQQRTSKRRAAAISTALLLALLALNSITGVWWPYIYLTIGAPLFVRQFLQGRTYDSIVSLAVFGGLFAVSNFDIDWTIILPVAFISSAILILFREFFNPFAIKEPEAERDRSIEIMEEEESNHK